ncbi:MAG: hypothetical protein HDT48_02005 [Ruminococcaceae bacterium]|nr:hypothetical protein [Oscillospiraceae bacterium]
MIKMITPQNKSSEDDIPVWDLPRRVDALIERLESGLKEKTADHYNDIEAEIKRLQSLGVEHDRQRFLRNVRDSLILYLYPNEHVDVDNPLYYISLYFMEDGENISYVRLSEDGMIAVTSNGSLLAKTIMYNMDRFREMFRFQQGSIQRSIEGLLAEILVK